MKFLVKVQKTIVMTAEVEVDADDESEACERAEEMAKDGEVQWISEMENDSDYDITNSEEI